MNKKNNIFEYDGGIKDYIDKNKHTWVEESYLTSENKKIEYLSSNFNHNKIKWLIILIISVFFVMIFRVGYLQIAKGNEYRFAAENNRIRIHELKAPRGIIYDRNESVLAKNVPNFILSFIPADLPKNKIELEDIADNISKYISLSAEDITRIFTEAPEFSYENFIVQDHVHYEEAMLLNINSVNLPGIQLESSSFREYSASNYHAHILGYMGKITLQDLELNPYYSFNDYIGKSGIEQFYEEILRGVHGKKEVEVDSIGKESKVINISNPLPGKGIRLTIDSGLQDVLGLSLENTLKSNKSITGATAIAMDPNNGEIISLVSYPSYSSNDFTLGLTAEQYDNILNDPKKPLFNRAISGEYPSGSTIKPVVALAGLESGIINEHTTFLSTGGIQIDKWFFPDWKAGGHGITDVRKALSESVNTFFYYLGGGDNEQLEGLGVEKLTEYMRLFGLGSTLGIDLNGENDGFLPSKQWKEEVKKENWYIGDTYHLSIGQGDILVTPLQVASYTATIANGGTLYQPRLLDAVINDEGNFIEVDNVILNENFINKYNFQIVQDGLREAVLSGSARSLQSLSVSSAGKTGTAQFGNEGKTHAWFTSYAPFEKPEIVITVLVESGGGGETVALPIAKQGFEYWFNK
ncbi:MAG: penicillin-binding protein 2 [bacterium]|nr:penicillin-binding protein 2 [bacterium]